MNHSVVESTNQPFIHAFIHTHMGPGASIPPKPMMHFPLFQIPFFSEYLRMWGIFVQIFSKNDVCFIHQNFR